MNENCLIWKFQVATLPKLDYDSIQMTHIHDKLIFDCVNEALDMKRPFCLAGPPPSWKKAKRKLYFSKYTKENFESLFRTVEDMVVDWGLYMCGFIKDKPDLFLPYEINEETLEQIREEGLAKMMSIEVNQRRSIEFKGI